MSRDAESVVRVSYRAQDDSSNRVLSFFEENGWELLECSGSRGRKPRFECKFRVPGGAEAVLSAARCKFQIEIRTIVRLVSE